MDKCISVGQTDGQTKLQTRKLSLFYLCPIVSILFDKSTIKIGISITERIVVTGYCHILCVGIIGSSIFLNLD